jgi:hypothetical protein
LCNHVRYQQHLRLGQTACWLCYTAQQKPPVKMGITNLVGDAILTQGQITLSDRRECRPGRLNTMDSGCSYTECFRATTNSTQPCTAQLCDVGNPASVMHLRTYAKQASGEQARGPPCWDVGYIGKLPATANMCHIPFKTSWETAGFLELDGREAERSTHM